MLSLLVFIFIFADDRAIVLDHGNPSMKSQVKAFAAVESIYFLPQFFSFCILRCCLFPFRDREELSWHIDSVMAYVKNFI